VAFFWGFGGKKDIAVLEATNEKRVPASTALLSRHGPSGEKEIEGRDFKDDIKIPPKAI